MMVIPFVLYGFYTNGDEGLAVALIPVVNVDDPKAVYNELSTGNGLRQVPLELLSGLVGDAEKVDTWRAVETNF